MTVNMKTKTKCGRGKKKRRRKKEIYKDKLQRIKIQNYTDKPAKKATPVDGNQDDP